MTRAIHFLLIAAAVMVFGLAPGNVSLAEGVGLSGRQVTAIRVEGLKQVAQKLVLNQVRLSAGDLYDAKTVEEDIVRITHLGRFSSVTAKVEPRADGGVDLIYAVVEQALLSDVQVVGNKAISDQELLGLAVLRSGDPIDPFLIERASRQMTQAYARQGYFEAEVAPDENLLKESGILIFRVREGPMARIRKIHFEGNAIYDDDQLLSKIKSRTYIIIFRKGEVNREQLEADAALVRDFYRDSGYLDAQVGRKIEMSPDQKDAVVTFMVSEGRQYTVDRITITGNELFSEAQLQQAMVLKAGDVFAADRLRKTQEALVDMYGKLGFIETRVQIDRLFHENEPRVDLVATVQEGRPYTVGRVMVSGNKTTQNKVILRQVRGMRPGRRFDRSGIAKTQQRLKESPLFSEAYVTIQGIAADAERDVLIEVKEGRTGSLSFGAGVSSDAGVIGAVDLVQRNFDVADTPKSWEDFFTGKAFRGAGQYFSLNLQPGNEFSRYAVSFAEPALLETDYSLSTSLSFFTRDRDRYQEERVGGTVSVGRRFGDVWTGSISARAEAINITSIDVDAPVDVFAVQGDSLVTSIGVSLTRNTTDSRLFPTRGSVLEMSLGRTGALGGDFDFTAAGVEYRKYWTIDEDFYGVRTVLSARGQVGYILEDNEAPIFERLYSGGHRSFRGFKFRGVGPRGVRNDTGVLGDDPVGGNWLFLLGSEYNVPIYQDVFRGVLFIDSGTVQKDIGFDQYRVAVGAGVRIKIPFLGQAPFALDFAFPVAEQDGDDTQVFSFDLAVPF